VENKYRAVASPPESIDPSRPTGVVEPALRRPSAGDESVLDRVNRTIL
jgi:hypothetical protein